MDQADWKIIETNIADGASKTVASLLHQPKDLTEILRARKDQITTEKATIDVMMKTMLQSHIEGVHSSIGNMDNVVNSIQRLRSDFQGILKDLKEVKNLNHHFREIREEHSRHSQLGAAVENAKQIFNVAEIAEKTQRLIEEGKLLLAHQSISDLERSRDDLMFEFFKQPSTSHMDQITLERYFQPVEKLSVALAAQIWTRIARCINIIRQEPAIIVSCLRIIEREERIDAKAIERKAASGFCPNNRPKQWRAKCFSVLDHSVSERIEGSKITESTKDKTWLVTHLEVIRKNVLSDLSVVRGAAIPCFPPDYDIMNAYARMYHQSIAKQIAELIDHEKLQAEDIVTMLTWLEEYEGPDCLGSPHVQINVKTLGEPLLAQEKIEHLVDQYQAATSINIDNWLTRALNVEKSLWMSDQKPDESTQYFQTQTPTDVFQIFDQNINIASRMGESMAKRMYAVCLGKLAAFSISLKNAFFDYRTEKFKDRSQLMNYTPVMMALVNDCSRYIEFVQLWAQKKSGLGHTELVSQCYECFEHIRLEAIACLLEEPLHDLSQSIKDLFTAAWQKAITSESMHTIAATLKDYGGDYQQHLMLPNFVETMEIAQLKILRYYLQAILDRKLKFRSAEERSDAADRLGMDIEILSHFNMDLAFATPVNEGGKPVVADDKVDILLSYEIFENICELLRCEADMIQLELSTFVQKFPDVSPQQLARLLDIRGDMKIDLNDLSRNDGSKILDVMSGEFGRKKTRTIFSEVGFRPGHH
ncbi:Exocyst complex component 3 [Hypsibius exemplaris]|uniref:Exocyst complex component 3 n=1 Tax=Hypsibius exemplaris TaxID=2072580 RepID=A0A1W0XCY9_HYPEX|nr:Exocyst complex component 3 [Hypsibius exemplaris]